MAGADTGSLHATFPTGWSERWPNVVATCPWVLDWKPDDVERFERLFDEAERHLRGDCDTDVAYSDILGIIVRDCKLSLPGRETGTWEQAKCPWQREDEITRAVTKAGLPKRHLKRLDDLEQTEAVARAREWVVNFRDGARGLLIVGPVGTGKTQVAVSAVYELIRADRLIPRWRSPAVFYATCGGLLDGLRDFEGKAKWLRENVEVCSVLILDDLGAEAITDWGRGVLGEVIDACYRDCRTLLATTNLSRADMLEHLGERAVSRLHEMTEIIVLSGTDRRRSGPDGD